MAQDEVLQEGVLLPDESMGPPLSASLEGAYEAAIRLRGLPWNCSEKEVVRFLGDETIREEGVVLVHNASGDGFVFVRDASKTLSKKRRSANLFGKVEAWPESIEIAEKYADLCNKRPDGGYRGVVRLSQLPPTATSPEAVSRDILDDAARPERVCLVWLSDDDSDQKVNHRGAEAYAVFESVEKAKEAVLRIGDRAKASLTSRGEMYAAEHWAELRHRPEGPPKDLLTFSTLQKVPPLLKDFEFAGVLKLRGLPFESTRLSVAQFLKEYDIEGDAVYFPSCRDQSGRPSGECYVIFDKGEAEARRAASEKNGHELGGRWLELYEASLHDFASKCLASIRATNHPEARDKSVLRLRGLPFQATLSDLNRLIEAASTASRGAFAMKVPEAESLFITGDGARRPAGEAFCLIDGGEDRAIAAANAVNGATLGDRVVTALPSCKAELFTSLGDEALHSKTIILRGLPFAYCDFQADPDHKMFVDDFFGENLKKRLKDLILCRTSQGRATGDAYALFDSREATVNCLALNRADIGGRFVEVFPCSYDEYAREKDRLTNSGPILDTTQGDYYAAAGPSPGRGGFQGGFNAPPADRGDPRYGGGGGHRGRSRY